MLSFKPTFPLSSFTVIKRLFSSLSYGSRKAGCKSVFGAFECRVRSEDKKWAFTRALSRFPLTLRCLVSLTFKRRRRASTALRPGRRACRVRVPHPASSGVQAAPAARRAHGFGSGFPSQSPLHGLPFSGFPSRSSLHGLPVASPLAFLGGNSFFFLCYS